MKKRKGQSRVLSMSNDSGKPARRIGIWDTTLTFQLELVVRRHLLRRGPRGSVNALQHRPRFVPPPVRPRHGFKVNGFGVDLLGGLHVRARAQIPPLVADVVNRDRFGFDGLQNLKLVRFVYFFNPALRFGARDFLTA